MTGSRKFFWACLLAAVVAVIASWAESYGGICKHSAGSADFDRTFIAQDFGGILVPLEMVERVVPGAHATKESPQPTPAKSQGPTFDFAKGVNYVSWTTGDYPFTCSWKRQTYHNSQGIGKVAISAEKAFRGKGCLEVTLDIRPGTDTHLQGETYFDVRYGSGFSAISPVKVKHNKDGKPLGVDLSGAFVGAVVLCENGLGGYSACHGLQIFLKSLRIDESGKEVWSSYYGNWHNIWRPGPRYHLADKALGDVHEGAWSLVTVKVPEKGKIVAPPYGDADFDPTQVALIGLKFGVNKNASGRECSGKRIWIDHVGWKHIESENDPSFDLHQLPHPLDVKAWGYFVPTGVKPLNLARGPLSTKSRTLRCKGNTVVFDFEQIKDPVSSLQKNGFNIVGIVNTEYMPDKSSVTIGPRDGKSHTFEELEALVKLVHRRGMRVMLKPHVDVVDDTWRGEIQPVDKARWFESYERFILRYAKLAAENEVEMLCLGTEFKSLDGSNRPEWEKLIRSIRQDYSGLLTYAANWDAYQDVCFWDLLDVVGIDAYFPISNKQDPSLEELVVGWSRAPYDMKRRCWGITPTNWIGQLEQWQQTVGQEIVFTEIGYRSTDFAAREPWEYQEPRPVNLELQARCYRAVLEAFREKQWFKGVFWWLWSPNQDCGGDLDTGFTPQHKPAQRVFLQSRQVPRP